MNKFQRVPASSIKVERRAREDLGDVGALAASIEHLGLLQPIVLRSDMTLVAGMRRYVAMTEHLGWTELPAYLVDNLEDERRALKAEMAENSERLDLSPYERVLKGAEIEAVERAAAERASRFAPGTHTVPSQVPDLLGDQGVESEDRGGSPLSGEALRRVAKTLGMSDSTYRKAREIVQAAEADPERFADLAMELHTTRNTAGTYRHFKNRQAEHQQQELAAAPPEERPVIYKADPAEWLHGQSSCDLVIAAPPLEARSYEDTVERARSWLPQALSLLRPNGRAFVFVGTRPAEIAAYTEVVRECLVRFEGMVLCNMLAWTWRNVVGPPPVHDYRDNWCGVLHIRARNAPALNCPTMAEQFGAQELPAPENELVLGREKPFELVSRLVSHTTQPGGRVLVPWAGSGEAILAAHKLGRVVAGCESDEELLRRAEAKGCRVDRE